MTRTTGIRRRNFLVGSGIVAAHTTLAGRATHAAESAPPAPPAPPVPPPPAPSATQSLSPKPGVAPGYIISGRGEDLRNPYFHPLGGPSPMPRPTPPPVNGSGANENDQGQNQNSQGGNQQ